MLASSLSQFFMLHRPTSSFLIMRFFEALVVSLLAATSSVQAVCVNTVGACGPGCWNQDDLLVSGDLRVCVPVGVGRYSPNGSNMRFTCAVGSYSGVSEASSCTLCEPGSFGGRTGLAACSLCPSGFYQDLEGQAFCRSCTQGYNGLGANAILDPNFCHLAGPSEMPSATPSAFPSSSPSSKPSHMPSSEPSTSPSAAPTPSPSISPTSIPSSAPSTLPSAAPSEPPTGAPSSIPTVFASFMPSLPPSLQPSGVPSTFPSVTPSEQPSLTPSLSPSVAPSVFPSAAPSVLTVLNGALKNNEPHVCTADEEFALHGECAECPSFLRSIALGAVFVLLVLSLIAFFVLTAPCCSAVLFIGVEFFQVLSLVGITHMPWPRILEIFFAFAALFGLDFDIIAPMQCHLGFSPQGSHAVILTLPIILSTIAGCCSYLSFALGRSTKDDLRRNLKTVLRIVCLGLFFGSMKLSLTSLEAVTCSSVQSQDEDGFENREIDWFCFGEGDAKDKVIALVGLLGVLVYGIGLPTFLAFLLYHHHDQVEESTGRIEDPTVLGEMAHLFLLPYRVDRWWWSAFVLARKFAFVNMVVFFQDAPGLGLIFIAVVLVLSGAAQWKQSPYFQDSKIEKTAFFQVDFLCRNQTVDLALHASIILVVVLGLLFGALPDDADARVGLGILGLLVVVPSMLYLLGAGVFHSRQRFSGEKSSLGETDLAGSVDMEGHAYEADIPDSTSSFLMSDSDSCTTNGINHPGSIAQTESDLAPESLLTVETVGDENEWKEDEASETAMDKESGLETDTDVKASNVSNGAAQNTSRGLCRTISFAHA